MNQVFTPDRAERLASTLEAQGLRVVRLMRESLVVSQRELGGVRLDSRVYAQVWKGRDLRLVITYETMRSGLL